jgi:hypothetical protein
LGSEFFSRDFFFQKVELYHKMAAIVRVEVGGGERAVPDGVLAQQ